MVKLQVIGYLGRDAITNTVNGKTVINFTVAHTDKIREANGELKDKTIWVDCAYWTDRTAIAPYLKKGTQVYAEGNGDIRTYTTQDGRNGATLTLRVLNVQLLGSKNTDGGNTTASNYSSNPTTTAPQTQQQTYNTPPTNVQPAPQQPSDLVEPLDDLPF